MDDDDSFEDDLKPALLITNDCGDDFDLDIPPTSGNEYLRRVRQEAKGCPQVVVADIDTKNFQTKQTVRLKQGGGCHPAPKGFAFDVQWQRKQAANFAELRQNLARQKALRRNKDIQERSKLPASNDVEGWCRLCFGRLEPPGSKPQELLPEGDEEEGQTGKYHKGTMPLLSIVIAMDQPTIVKVLEYHINWFEATGFTEKQGCWFYALLASLQKPLSPEACSLIRSLARGCASLRATLEHPEDERLVPLNLFICLVSRYFDQGDLAEGGSRPT